MVIIYKYNSVLSIHDESVFRLQLNEIDVINVGILVTDMNNCVIDYF